MRAIADELNQAIGFQTAAMSAGLEEGMWEDALDACLESTTKLVDEMIRPRIDPLTVPNNQILKRITLSISVYQIWLEYARNQVPESVRLDKEEAMKMLEKIQKGSLEIMPEDAEINPISAEFEARGRELGVRL